MEIISIDQDYNNRCGCCGFLCDSKTPNFLGECIKCNTIACKICYQTGTWNCDIGCRECCGKCDYCIKFYKEIIYIDKHKQTQIEIHKKNLNKRPKFLVSPHKFLVSPHKC